MKLSAYSLIGPYYTVIDVKTGEIIKGIQYVDTKLGILVVLKPNSDPTDPDEYSVDKDGKYETIIVKRTVKIVRNTNLFVMGVLVLWTVIRRK